jgi:hypothetical protein
MSGTDLVLQPFASSGDKFTPPQSVDPNGFMSFNLGYTTNYELDLSTGNLNAHPVERQNLNYLFYLLTSGLQEFQQYGFSVWFNSMPGGYGNNACVRRLWTDGITWKVWQSQVANNTVDPNTGGQTSWTVLPTLGAITAASPMPAGGATLGPSGELVTASQDFNTFATGTYEFQTDAIASGSANSPSPLAGTGSGTVAGMLEVKQWNSSPNVTIAQRYTDRNGNVFIRGAYNGTWTTWTQATPTQMLGSYKTATPVSVAVSPTNLNIGALYYLPSTASAGYTVTLPNTQAGGAVIAAGGTFSLANYSSTYNLTVTASGSDTFFPNNRGSTSIVLAPGESVRFSALSGGAWGIIGGSVASTIAALISGTTITSTVDVSGGSQTCSVGVRYINQNNSAVAWTLPVSPTKGQRVTIIDLNTNYNSTVNPNGNPIKGVSGTMTIDYYYGPLDFVFDNATIGWVLE